MTKKQKINVVTLGCSKNLVDSEHLLSQLSDSGFDVVFESNNTDAKTVVINTCGFIGDAKEESVNTILSFANAKSAGLIDNLFVMGCLSERYRDDLVAEIPEVDEFFGVNNIWDIVRRVGGEYHDTRAHKRLVTTPSHYAYLKISEGCSWGCGYCAIPLIRGKHVSVPMEALVEEARELAANGVRELIVIAQDTTYYGIDLYGERRLAPLLSELSKIDGIKWIRLHYAYPANFPRDVIDVLASNPKICKYIDIPFQHISDSQLKSMRRGVTKAETYELIKFFRDSVPDIAIRTTLLTGYPGESEEDFEELLRFVEDLKFDRLGVFPYSEEEQTHSALNLKDDVSPEVKEQRVDRIMSLQNEISRVNNLRKVGTTMQIIIDRIEGDYYVGRSQYDSPEVDGEILIESKNPLRVGEFITVKIDSSDDYDLFAKL